MDEIIGSRIKRVLDIVREEGADALLVFNHELSGQPGTRYLSGFSGTESVLLIAEKEDSYLPTAGISHELKKNARILNWRLQAELCFGMR